MKRRESPTCWQSAVRHCLNDRLSNGSLFDRRTGGFSRQPPKARASDVGRACCGSTPDAVSL